VFTVEDNTSYWTKFDKTGGNVKDFLLEDYQKNHLTRIARDKNIRRQNSIIRQCHRKLVVGSNPGCAKNRIEEQRCNLYIFI